MLHATICLSSFPMVSCVRVRLRVPEPHVSVQDPHSDQFVHPIVVVSGVVLAIVDASVVISAPVAGSLSIFLNEHLFANFQDMSWTDL